MTARKPVAGWRVNHAGNAYVLDLGPITAAAYLVEGAVFWCVIEGRADADGWLNRRLLASPNARGQRDSIEAAQLAAEDAARALLLAGLASLAPPLPAGYEVSRREDALWLTWPDLAGDEDGVCLGDDSAAMAVACALLAAVRK